MATSILNLGQIEAFDTEGAPASLAQRWEKWRQRFMLYLAATGVTKPAQKRALLLHCAGPTCIDIFETLPNTGTDSDFQPALEALNTYFEGKKNVTFERHVFRAAAQGEGEAMCAYVSRLRKFSKTCEYGALQDDMIRDQVIDKCTSNKFRRRFLREQNLTLDKLCELASAMEAVEDQATKIKGSESTSGRMDTVNKVDSNSQQPQIGCRAAGRGRVKGGLNAKLRYTSKKLYAYQSDEPLEIKGVFAADICLADGKVSKHAEFVVLNGKGCALLGRDTAIKLGVLCLKNQVNAVDSEAIGKPDDLYVQKLLSKHSACFSGLGKLKDYQVKLHIDPSVTPIAQRQRKIPYSQWKAVEKRLKELEDLDVIERVEGPTSWVSAPVIVPKRNGEIRLCIDMRMANKAIIRERHPIPTIDDVLHDLNGAKVFSKIDLRWGYHQIELHPESRDITTFSVLDKLYRYKRLMFGITSAPEVYQHIIHEVLATCGKVKNISDDLIVYGDDDADHDKYLDKVLTKLVENGLTANLPKCLFRMRKLVFYGHVLSDYGIALEQAKISAVVSAREPVTPAEVLVELDDGTESRFHCRTSEVA
ncbi:PREDICTED: uncharacterized protein K02A2.6-like [Priapulus caudatus]|uniref:Uncharacterized protein K02A2.6-like n=1 Tax=Priapulus caudatus TaxID=37621 RepID=A0ABM1EZN4_PRICU|nr:PREDICTED: uncharacterized protein K02A2.6-like [Priapulus caudatus]